MVMLVLIFHSLLATRLMKLSNGNLFLALPFFHLLPPFLFLDSLFLSYLSFSHFFSVLHMIDSPPFFSEGCHVFFFSYFFFLLYEGRHIKKKKKQDAAFLEQRTKPSLGVSKKKIKKKKKKIKIVYYKKNDRHVDLIMSKN